MTLVRRWLLLFMSTASALPLNASLALTSTMQIPLVVHVGLLGFAADGAWQVELDAAELHGMLARLLPMRTPRCGPTDSEQGEATYRFTYNVVQMRTGLAALHRSIAGALVPSAGGKAEVRVPDVAEHFDRIHASYFESEPSSHTILVINPNRADIREAANRRLRTPLPLDFAYHYVAADGSDGTPGVPTQMWIATSRYMVLDLSAGPSTRGMSGASPGSVASFTVPAIHAGLQGGEAARARSPAQQKAHVAEHTTLLARLTVMLTTAIRHVIVPDARSCELPDFTETLLVPLIVLRDHRAWDPLKPGHAHSLDVAALEAQVSRLLLPGQSLRVLASTHQLHSHPAVSVALARALQSDTIRQQNASGHHVTTAHAYIDVGLLASRLRRKVDWLTSGLLEHESDQGEARPIAKEQWAEHPAYHLHHSWSSFPGWSAASADAKSADGNAKSPSATPPARASVASQSAIPATRVLPVFLFSLLGIREEVLLEGKSLVHSSEDAIFLLQKSASALPVPFFAGGQQLSISTLDPTAPALAGFASSIGGLLAPFESFWPRGVPARDFLWSVGHHPFGPFAKAAALPAVMVDVAQRHVVLSRVGTVISLLHKALGDVEALAARYVHPSSREWSVHREELRLERDDELLEPHEAWADDVVYDGLDAMLAQQTRDAQALEPARGVGGGSASLLPGGARRGGVGGGGISEPLPGELMQLLEEGNLTLIDELVHTETLRLHAKLSIPATRLVEVRRALEAGALSKAHAEAAELLAEATDVTAAVADALRSLEEALRCHTVEISHPRSVPYRLLLAVGAVATAAVCLFAATRRLSAGTAAASAPWGARARVGRDSGAGAASAMFSSGVRPGATWGGASSRSKQL